MLLSGVFMFKQGSEAPLWNRNRNSLKSTVIALCDEEITVKEWRMDGWMKAEWARDEGCERRNERMKRRNWMDGCSYVSWLGESEAFSCSVLLLAPTWKLQTGKGMLAWILFAQTWDVWGVVFFLEMSQICQGKVSTQITRQTDFRGSFFKKTTGWLRSQLWKQSKKTNNFNRVRATIQKGHGRES